MSRLALRRQPIAVWALVLIAGLAATSAAVVLSVRSIAVTEQDRLEILASRVVGDVQLATDAIVSVGIATATLASPDVDGADATGPSPQLGATAEDVAVQDGADAGLRVGTVDLGRAVQRLSGGRDLDAIADGLLALAIVEQVDDQAAMSTTIVHATGGQTTQIDDDLQEGAVADALERSALSGGTAMSAPTSSGAVVAAVPIYGNVSALQPTTSSEARVASLLGWMLAVVDPGALARSAGQSAGDVVAVQLTDVTDEERTPLGSHGTAADSARSRPVLLSVSTRTWEVTTTPERSLLSPAERRLPWLVGVTGLIVTAAALALVILLLTQRQRALAQVSVATQALTDKNDELRRSNSMLQQFAGVVAHDLKNPLTVLRAVPTLTRRLLDDDLPDRLVSVLDAQEGAAARMHELIDDLLAYSKVGGADPVHERIDLTEMVREQITMLPAVQHGQAEVEVRPLPEVTADRAMLRQAVANLLGNAVKYVPDDRAPRVRVTAEVDDAGMVSVHVDDNGVGIPPAERHEVTEAFRRSSRTAGYEGTGLGLAIVSRVMAAHGGALDLDDSPMGGTRATLVLPTDVSAAQGS